MTWPVSDITHYSDLNLLLGAEVSHIGANLIFVFFFLNIIFKQIHHLYFDFWWRFKIGRAPCEFPVFKRAAAHFTLGMPASLKSFKSSIANMKQMIVFHRRGSKAL